MRNNEDQSTPINKTVTKDQKASEEVSATIGEKTGDIKGISGEERNISHKRIGGGHKGGIDGHGGTGGCKGVSVAAT
jgi:hypothetical protein